MQQTTSRKLSIIESSDPFLPEALNDNTRKIERSEERRVGKEC